MEKRANKYSMTSKLLSQDTIWGILKRTCLIQRSLLTGLELSRICLKTKFQITSAFDVCEIGCFLYILDRHSLHRIHIFTLENTSYGLPGIGHTCLVSVYDVIYLLGVTCHVFYTRTGAFKHLSDFSTSVAPARCVNDGILYLAGELISNSSNNIQIINLNSFSTSSIGFDMNVSSGNCLIPLSSSTLLLVGGLSYDMADILDLTTGRIIHDSILMCEARFICATIKRLGNSIYIMDSCCRLHKYDIDKHTWKIYSDHLWNARKVYVWYWKINRFGDGLFPLYKLPNHIKKMICCKYL